MGKNASHLHVTIPLTQNLAMMTSQPLRHCTHKQTSIIQTRTKAKNPTKAQELILRQDP